MRIRGFNLLFVLLLTTTALIFQWTWGSSSQVSAHAPMTGPNPTPTPFHTYLPFVVQNYLAPSPLWRFGLAQVRQSLLVYNATDVTRLRLGWYTDFTVSPSAPRPYGIEYVPTVRLKQWKVLDPGSNPPVWTAEGCITCAYVSPPTYTLKYTSFDTIRSFAAARPGMMWLIGNEMERIDWGTPNGYQDEILPEEYAVAYHEIYSAIKSADPTAQVAIGGMIQATPLRLQYLDRVWSAYTQTYGITMPVDVWNIHGFVLQEKSCRVYPDPSVCYGADIPAGFMNPDGMQYTQLQNKDFTIVQGHLIAMRTWMKQHGEQNKPLVVSEYGVLMPDWVSPGDFTPLQVRNSFMNPSFDYFRNTISTTLGYPADGYHLVQRWSWYSLDGDDGYPQSDPFLPYINGYLFNSGLPPNPAPKGLLPLGSYWIQYVQALPPGSVKPYVPSKLP